MTTVQLLDCIHRFMRTHFRPDTDLHIFKDLIQNYDYPNKKGLRSLKSTFQLSWTVLSLTNREASADKCCGFCVPSLLARYSPPHADDSRLSAYAGDFIYPLQLTASVPTGNLGGGIPLRPHSLSISSNSSTSSNELISFAAKAIAIAVPMSQAVFIPIKHRFNLPQSQCEKLRARLEQWREEHRVAERGEFSLLSSQVDLPDSALKKILDHGGDFLRVEDITPATIQKVVQLDLASPSDFQCIAAIISDWRQDAALEITPSSHAGRRKKIRKNLEHSSIENDLTPRPSPRRRPKPLSQPVFQLPPTAAINSARTPTVQGSQMDVFSSAQSLPSQIDPPHRHSPISHQRVSIIPPPPSTAIINKQLPVPKVHPQAPPIYFNQPPSVAPHYNPQSHPHAQLNSPHTRQWPPTINPFYTAGTQHYYPNQTAPPIVSNPPQTESSNSSQPQTSSSSSGRSYYRAQTIYDLQCR